ncbi:MAG: GntR family transcriptional regulator [Propionibacteriaceae bacterium]
MILIAIDADDFTPPYEQIRRQIENYVMTGELHAGQRLPTVRQLARDLGLAMGTVARAYKELEVAGVITTARGAGTTISVNPTTSGAREQSFQRLTATFIANMRKLGASDDEISRYCDAELGL